MTVVRRRLAAALVLSAVTVCAVSGFPADVSAHPSKSEFAKAVPTTLEHRVPRLKRLRRHQERRP